MQRSTEWHAYKAHPETISVSTTIMEHQMIKNIKLSTAVFATAILGGVALVRLAAAATKEVEGTKVDAREDRAEAKADRKADKAEAKADRVEDKADRAEAKMMRHHEAEGTKADIAEDKAKK
jgi:hypothetical protein